MILLKEFSYSKCRATAQCIHSKYITSSSKAPDKVFKNGNNEAIALMTFIEDIEKAADKQTQKNYIPMQASGVSQYLQILNRV